MCRKYFRLSNARCTHTDSKLLMHKIFWEIITLCEGMCNAIM